MCFRCGVVGHDKRECKAFLAIIQKGNNEPIPLYGTWLSVDCPEDSCFSAALKAELAKQTLSTAESLKNMNLNDPTLSADSNPIFL